MEVSLSVSSIDRKSSYPFTLTVYRACPWEYLDFDFSGLLESLLLNERDLKRKRRENREDQQDRFYWIEPRLQGLHAFRRREKEDASVPSFSFQRRLRHRSEPC